MSFLRNAALTALIAAATSLCVLAAPAYNDVLETHWAYSSISKMADKGYILGDNSNNYKPDSYVDKFETSKILAKALGYKSTDTAINEETYKKHKSLLDQYQKAFLKWTNLADKEIAFLLEKGILTKEDLAQFVIKDVDGTERLRATSREELSVFLVKLIGKKDQALSLKYTNSYNDDKNITLSAKPYVYYLAKVGVIAPSDNFNPKTAANKAIFAVMLDKSISLLQQTKPEETKQETKEETKEETNLETSIQNAAELITKIETITGVVDKLYPSVNGIQITNSSGVKKIYKLATSVTIYVNNSIKTINDLEEGMNFVGVVNNGSLVDVKAQSNALSTTTTTTPNTSTTTPNTSTATPPNQTQAPQTSEITTKLFTLEGIVKSVSDGAKKTISVEVRMLNPRGDITTETREYSVTADVKITRGDSSTTFDKIQDGDVCKLQFFGDTAVSIELEEKNRKINDGILIEKKYIEQTGTPILVILDKNDKKHEFRVTSTTKIERKRNLAAWNDLRNGDIIQAEAEYDRLLSIVATSTSSTIEGVIEEIHNTKSKSLIHLRDDKGEVKSYELIAGTVDVYSIRLNSRVRLRLDSLEVEAITILKEAPTVYATGYVQTVSNNKVTIKDLSFTSKDVLYNYSTIIINSETGATVSPSYLKEDMRVYIVYTSNSSNIAKTITILS